MQCRTKVAVCAREGLAQEFAIAPWWDRRLLGCVRMHEEQQRNWAPLPAKQKEIIKNHLENLLLNANEGSGAKQKTKSNLEISNESLKVKAAIALLVVAVGLDIHARALENADVVSCNHCNLPKHMEENQGSIEPQVGSET